LLNLRDRAGEVVGLGEFGRRGIKDLQSVMQKAFCNSICQRATFRGPSAKALSQLSRCGKPRIESEVAMRKEPATRLLHLARQLAAEPGGITLDDIAARFEVSRRTAERMRAVIDKGHRAPFCCGDRSAASIRQSRSGRNKRQPSRSNRLE
jgi:hypothetical protein